MGTNEMSKKKVYATWWISLNCDCPSCGERVDLLDDVDFWDCRNDLEIGQSKEDVEVYCPKCDHEFTVNIEY